jgi:hypothetical protein
MVLVLAGPLPALEHRATLWRGPAVDDQAKRLAGGMGVNCSQFVILLMAGDAL